MNFNYRDFFITNNDDLNIIKEELSIVDEAGISKKDRLATHAKAVWDMYNVYKKEPSGTDGSSGSNEPKIEQNIADELDINLSTVQKIIQICLMNTVEKKNPPTIANELGIDDQTVRNILNNAFGSERERDKDTHFINDAVKIYNLYKNGKTPEEIVDLVNNEKPKHFEKITVDKVNLVLTIVDTAKKQMGDFGEVNVEKIHGEIGKKIARNTINRLIKKLNLGKMRYQHEYTEEQDAFILYLYLQGNGPSEIARQFNKKFTDPKGNALNILPHSIGSRLRDVILTPQGESEISDYVLYLLNRYETEYFSAVNINNDETKEKLTHYTAPERIKGRDPLARKGGKVDSTRQISGQFGNLEPGTHQTFTTGETPVSGQLGKKSGAPMNPQGAIRSISEHLKR